MWQQVLVRAHLHVARLNYLSLMSLIGALLTRLMLLDHHQYGLVHELYCVNSACALPQVYRF